MPRLKDLNKTREKSERGIIELVLDKGKLLFKRQSGLAVPSLVSNLDIVPCRADSIALK